MRYTALLLAGATSSMTATLNLNGQSAILSMSSSLVKTLVSFYNPSSPGVLPAPYYWWESAGMWDGMLSYWQHTGNSQYNALVSEALISQAGASHDFMGPATDGNDDQAWWALACVSAAEGGLPGAPNAPSWLNLAQNVFNALDSRWDTSTCNGGMKWKIAPGVPGYDYKSTIANGLYFQLAARLAKLVPQNPTYAAAADKAYAWTTSVGLIDKKFNVFDGTDDSKGCVDVDHDSWSYNTGAFLYGTAVMQSLPNADPNWAARLTGLLAAAQRNFFNAQGIMVESQCEPKDDCDTDQLSFKAYLARWMKRTAELVPSTQNNISKLLQSSAEGAIASCAAGPGGGTCGAKWSHAGWDGTQGVGQQMSALEVVMGLVVPPSGDQRMRRVRTFRA